MSSDQHCLLRANSLEQGLQKVYKVRQIIESLQIFLFLNPSMDEANLESSNNSDNKYYFFQNEQSNTITQKQVQQALSQMKKVIARQLFDNFDEIKFQIQKNFLNNSYLKYLYGVLNIRSIDENVITRILIWIYSLCYGNYQRQSMILKDLLHASSKTLIMLGLQIISTQNETIRQKMQNTTDVCSKKMEKRFKKAMAEYIKNQQQKNHQEAYVICRICQSHISVNLMHAHLVLCETTYEKKYLELKIQEIGRQLLHKIMLDQVQYDLLDERADIKLIFQRIFSKLGQKTIIFQIKDDEPQMDQVIQQFKENPNFLIRKTVELLQKYYINVTVKASVVGYDSDQGLKFSQNSHKLKSSKLVSRNSLKLSSKSLNPDSDSKSSSGSLKQIRFNEQNFTKSSKSFYTLDDFQIIKLVGKGAYSEVYLVKNINTADLFAMKVVEVQTVDNETLQALKKQQQIYKRISSEYAIKLFYTFSDQNLHFFLLQYANGGNLRDLLQEQTYLEEQSARLYIANLILAIEQIHQMKIIHRDLKPENIVIDEQGFLKLTDFNLAFMLTAYQQTTDQTNKFFGSPDYISPEVINSQLKHHPSRDIWSLGIIAYEILIGVTPFTAMEIQQVFQNILQGQIQWPEIGNQQGMISEDAKHFISSLLQPDPCKRLGYIGIADLKSHPFFKSINWNNIRQHRPFFVPKRQTYQLKQNASFKQKILERKTSKNTNDFPSLGCIIRYDVLKSKSSLKAKSARKSRFKMQKELNELKMLTSMDSFPTPYVESLKSLSSSQSRSLSSDQSSKTIEFNEVSFKIIQAASHKHVIQEQIQDDYEIKINSPCKSTQGSEQKSSQTIKNVIKI